MEKRTLRQYLDLFGGPDHIDIHEGTKLLLDSPLDEAWFCTDTTDPGRLFVICGGYCLMGFKIDKRFRGCLYIVFDDNSGQGWDVQRTNGKTVNDLGPRPSPRLRLVESI